MKSSKYTIIALLSFSVIFVELSWTRIFSAEFFYTFAFLILSMAVLGLGIGALAVYLFSDKLKSDNAMFWIISLMAFSILASPPLVFLLGIDFSVLYNDFWMIFKVLLAVILLSSSYFFGGMALALFFRQSPDDMPRMYMYDLIGASLAVVLAVLAMNIFGTPVASFLAAVPVIAALFILNKKKFVIIPIVLSVVMLVLAYFSVGILEAKHPERAPIIYKHWNALSKIEVHDYDANYKGILQDNVSGSTVIGFDGNYERPDSMMYDYGINIKYLLEQFPDSCTFLSLGAGGGMDILQALFGGADEIHAVEVNPQVVWLMTDGILGEFSGRIYEDPRVVVAVEDARSYIRQFEGKFDIIYSLSSNTFAALASGAFALAENYLFTVEAFQDYWRALSDEGYMMMEHQAYVPRMVSELIIALEAEGVSNPKQHFAVYEFPDLRRKAILLSKKPLTNDIIANAFNNPSGPLEQRVQRLYPPPAGKEGNLVNRIIEEGWEAAQKDAPIDLSPADDNRPFTSQLGMWKNISSESIKKIVPYEFYGFPVSKLIIVSVIGIILLIIIPLNIFPYFLRREKKLGFKPWLFYFLIGMAFMIIEVVLIQKYTFFIGPSVYSIITILMVLLLAGGIGSRMSPHFGTSMPFFAIFLWLLLDIYLLTEVVYALAELPMFARILVSAVFVFPVGFFMGMPFPKAARKTGELIDWGFAVNGAGSVLGASAVMLVVFSYGFTAALILGGVLYLGALAVFKLSWK